MIKETPTRIRHRILTDICKYCGLLAPVEDIIAADAADIISMIDRSAAYLMTLLAERDSSSIGCFLNTFWNAFMFNQISLETLLPELDNTLYRYQLAMWTKNAATFNMFPIAYLGTQKEKLGKASALTAIDIGGGMGFYTALLYCLGFSVTLVERAVNSTICKPQLGTIAKCLFQEFPFANHDVRWDVVLLSEVLHGRTVSEQIHWLKVILTDFLNDGGCLLVNEVNPHGPGAYSQTFDTRIKFMTKGQGGAISYDTLCRLLPDGCRVGCSFWGLDTYYLATITKE